MVDETKVPPPSDEPGNNSMGFETQTEEPQGERLPLEEYHSATDILSRLIFVKKGGFIVDRKYPNEEYTVAQARANYRNRKVPIKKGDKPVFVPIVDLFLDGEHRPDVANFEFAPGAPLTIKRKNRAFLNTWLPLDTVPYNETAPWMWDLFVDHVHWLFGDRAEDFLCWIAHIFQYPGKRPHLAWLHIAAETGCGRNWIADALAAAMDDYVALNVTLEGILEANYTGIFAKKLLAVVDEAKSSASRKKNCETSEKLKTMVTKTTMEINVKYGPQYTQKNVLRWLFFSNNFDALPILETDRRLEVAQFDGRRKSEDYYTKLYCLFENPRFGPTLCFNLMNYDISNYNAYAPAKMSETKQSVIDSVESEQTRALKEIRDNFPCEIIPSDWLIKIANYLMTGKVNRHFGTEEAFRLNKRELTDLGIKRLKKRFRLGGKHSSQLHFYAVRDGSKWTKDGITNHDVRIELSRAFGAADISDKDLVQMVDSWSD